ncbi:hypothetical protein PPL_08565 [Heterostelium album PN500]|uniref:TLDc domain-containing protein n=1 Tax=Heterostelium pallidum (strain ATCC 26659 / Pp 5 / PN500) TaxID=670386 RepID=D3BJ42_HETP5|nr:hypothetical protein PPL_08565 [Heterostelium album PN500]EFA77922.1 hypothetical protein PPL_08565 [Heterostelium album PN500]|eukprot:XP_020430050.1 hypothetical protein PPL_08565 [Heterostelium album PN500]
MLSGDVNIQSVSGKPNNTFFIDRDGTHFRYILNSLPDGDTSIPDSIKTEDQFKIISGWLGGVLSYELIYKSWNSNGAYYGDNKCFIYTMVNKNNIQPTKYVPVNTNIVFGHNGCGPTFSGNDLYISNQCNVNQQSYQNFPNGYADTTGKAKATFATTYNFTVSEIEVFNSQEGIPYTLAFFSSPPLGSKETFKFTKINLKDGSLNKTLTSQNNYNIISVTDYDGVNWYDFLFQQIYLNSHPTFGPGSFSDLGYGFDTFSDYYGNGMGVFNFTKQFVPQSKVTLDLYLPAWNHNNYNLDILTFDNYDASIDRFYYNRTGFVVDPKYTNSLVGALDQNTGLYYVNYVTDNTRSILVFNSLSTDQPVKQYKFIEDVSSGLSSQVYLLFTSIGNILYMVDTGNQMISLIAIELSDSAMTAQSKVVYSTSNAFGSPSDGLPFAYTENTDRHTTSVKTQYNTALCISDDPKIIINSTNQCQKKEYFKLKLKPLPYQESHYHDAKISGEACYTNITTEETVRETFIFESGAKTDLSSRWINQDVNAHKVDVYLKAQNSNNNNNYTLIDVQTRIEFITKTNVYNVTITYSITPLIK